MFDVVAPIQSFLGNVSRGLDVLTSDSSISRFLDLEKTFGNTGLGGTYSPWDCIDHFGRGQTRENLSSQASTSIGAGTSQSGTRKSPKVVRISFGKDTVQQNEPELEGSAVTKASKTSSKSAKL